MERVKKSRHEGASGVSELAREVQQHAANAPDVTQGERAEVLGGVIEATEYPFF